MRAAKESLLNEHAGDKEPSVLAKISRCIAIASVAVCAIAAAAPMAYVPNEGSATVSVIDTSTDKVTATLRIGQKPRGIAADREPLYISDQTTNALVVYDPAAGKEVGKVNLGDSPEAIYLSPDGKWLSAAIEENDQVLIVDTAALTVVKRIRTRRLPTSRSASFRGASRSRDR